jgi:hypothetical protein
VLLLQTVQTLQTAPSGWDNLRDWSSALGSLSAAVVATVAFLWSLRGRQDRAWAELSHQARRVVAWVETIKQPPLSSPRTWPSLGVIIQNNSEEPIHDCVIRIDIAPEHWNAAGHRHFVMQRQIVAPGRTEIPDLGLGRRDQSRLPVMWFTDSAGLRWTLSHTGRLARVVDRDDQRAVSGWRRVLPWRRHLAAPAVVEEQAADGQNAEPSKR